ncbi:TonB-dependent receptor [Duganella sp. Leaf126]|uniref:TonB-dependent receptor plug domain-containing protein n=1 Tax=Duganella sp. Leaf126 TaxID=1736266 RepID=UPI0006FEFBFA|nr:TonB-dependent receptor [Duganella sp. Leaf126]KQQ45879.1 TonB-dependent receptor [Duganella sp. Leaf126]
MSLSLFAAGMLLAAPAVPAEATATTATTTPAAEQQLQQVEVAGTRADLRQRETTTAIIYPHADLVRQGDQTLADALKRLPGISVGGASGQGGEISMRGLGQGYTQIMLNGEPVPAGFSLDTVAPDMIERVEILRSATAASSNQAVAGSINIVLKKAAPRGQRTITASATRQGGATSPSLSTQFSTAADSSPLHGQYSLAATVSRQRTEQPNTDDEILTDDSGATIVRRHTLQPKSTRDDKLTLAPRASWTLGKRDTVTWQGFANLRRLAIGNRADEQTLVGDASEFPRFVSDYRARIAMLRSDLEWNHGFASGDQLETRLGASSNRRDTGYDFYGMDAEGMPGVHRHVDAGPAETAVTFTGTWRHPVGAHHALAIGWDASRARRDEDRIETIFDGAGVQTGASNADYSAIVKRLALFAQDEWEISKQFSLYAGLRHERLQTTSRALAGAPTSADALDVRSAVWSPSLQARYALPDKDVLRIALARTYKAPPLAKLVPRRYTIDNNNNPTNPDEQGNPQLRPELAWGLDAAYEHYLGNGALVSVNLYWRRIRDVTQTRLFEEAGVWITAPFNNGNASVHGIELEAKLPLRRLLNRATAPAVDLRANLARNWSRVARVPGPGNTLEEQVPVTANLGADYTLPGSAWTVGGDFHYQGGVAARQSTQLWLGNSPGRKLDLYALRKLDARTQLRLSASNLLHQRERNWQQFRDADGAGASTRRRDTVTPTSAAVRIMLEHQF